MRVIINCFCCQSQTKERAQARLPNFELIKVEQVFPSGKAFNVKSVAEVQESQDGERVLPLQRRYRAGDPRLAPLFPKKNFFLFSTAALARRSVASSDPKPFKRAVTVMKRLDRRV